MMAIDHPGSYLKLLKNEETYQRSRSRQVAEHIRLDLLEDNNNDAVPDKLKNDSIENYVQRQNAALIDALSLTVFNDGALHELRKLLKELLHNWEYTEVLVTAILPEYFMNRNNVEMLAARLGDFHDLCVAVEFFKPIYISQIASASEIEALQLLEEELRLEKKELKQEIVFALDQTRPAIEEKEVIREAYEIM